MNIIPAIDLLNGKCVRLTQGSYTDVKVYNSDPAQAALEFAQAKLRYLHLVDLDGAKKGQVVNWEAIENVREKTDLHIDFGGGVKSEADLERLLELGINQINVGSLAAKEPDRFIQWLKTYGAENFILSADVRDGKVQIGGWTVETALTVETFIGQFIESGLQYATCTDISSDGMLQGPDFGLYKKLKALFPGMKIIASGGIATYDDLKGLEEMGVYGAIVGKAIYEKKLMLKDLKAQF